MQLASSCHLNRAFYGPESMRSFDVGIPPFRKAFSRDDSLRHAIPRGGLACGAEPFLVPVRCQPHYTFANSSNNTAMPLIPLM